MLLAHLLAAALLVLFPFWDRWEVRRLREAERLGGKSASYLRIIAGLWPFSLALLFVFPLPLLLRAPAPPGVLGLGEDLPASTTWLVVLAFAAGQVLPVVLALFNRGLRLRLVAASEAIGYLLPRSTREELLFAGVAVTAGITEELIYRGFLLRYLAAEPWGLSAATALVVSSAVFGLAHAGQGVRGVLATAMVGLLLGGLFLASGSLLLPILLHTLIDLRALAVAHLARREAAASPASAGQPGPA
jgi:membrane protease YdiL (CAAX protease family)